MSYTPPFSLTPYMMDMVFKIGEKVNRIDGYRALDPNPNLRKQNRIRSIHSSCAIEANSLSFDAVSDIINGHYVIGPEKDIIGVKNAIEAYSDLGKINPYNIDDFLKTHRIMVKGLEKEAGMFRTGAEGVFKGNTLIFMAPPPELVPNLMNDLFDWMKRSSSSLNPLIVSSIFHYEMVFIHPFTDGNGRMARLWQTAILGKWREAFHWIPIENRIEKAQQEYYDTIERCNNAGDSTLFIEFMLRMILTALEDAEYEMKNVSDAVPERVKQFIDSLERGRYYTINELMKNKGVVSHSSFLRDYISPAKDHGMIEMEFPDNPRSTKQRYRRIG